MKLFTGLKKIRDFERGELPFLNSVIDFDIVIEIGYEEEHHRPITLKRLYLLDICSRGTMRRKLSALIGRGIVVRCEHPTDKRASLLAISPAIVKLLSKYGGLLTAVSASHFK